MIPKIIHYCWYGGEKPAYVNRYTEGWRRLLPDWKFIEWNESNTNLQACAFIQEAYENKIYAFVADYARVDALIRHGGVYLDTDTELLKPLDAFLDCKLFLGYESELYFSLGVIGAQPGNELLQALLTKYQAMQRFPEPPVSINMYLTGLFFQRYPLERKNSRQSYKGIELYPAEVFSPRPVTENSIAVHHFAGSWLK